MDDFSHLPTCHPLPPLANLAEFARNCQLPGSSFLRNCHQHYFRGSLRRRAVGKVPVLRLIIAPFPRGLTSRLLRLVPNEIGLMRTKLRGRRGGDNVVVSR